MQGKCEPLHWRRVGMGEDMSDKVKSKYYQPPSGKYCVHANRRHCRFLIANRKGKTLCAAWYIYLSSKEDDGSEPKYPIRHSCCLYNMRDESPKVSNPKETKDSDDGLFKIFAIVASIITVCLLIAAIASKCG